MRSTRPPKATPPLIVNANRVLLHAIPLQLFQSIRRRLPQVLELVRRIDEDKLLEGAILHIGRDLPNSGGRFALPEICCSGVREAVNHASMKVAISWFPGKDVFTPSVKTPRPPRTRKDAVGWNVPGCPSIGSTSMRIRAVPCLEPIAHPSSIAWRRCGWFQACVPKDFPKAEWVDQHIHGSATHAGRDLSAEQAGR